MLKSTNVDIKESNIAKIGSAEDRAAKLAAAKTEKEWVGAGEKVGIQTWRIENFGVKSQDPRTAGTFYNGDCYIVLHTYKKDEKSNAFKYDLYFWLGADSSQDERGTAAFKTVELDDILGDTPVQHREVSGYESPEFLALFGGRITLLDGGVASAFTNVKPEEYKPRLLHIKGKKNVRIQQVPLSFKSLNHGDSFVLDAGLDIWLWNGASAGIHEKRKGEQVLTDLLESRLGKPKKKVIDESDDDEKFAAFLSGSKADIGAATPDIDDEKKAAAYNKSLYRLSDSTGDLKITEVSSGKGNVKRAGLTSDDVYILDLGIAVFVYVGKKTSKNEQHNAISFAEKFAKQKGHPDTTPITRIVEGGESQAFLNGFDL